MTIQQSVYAIFNQLEDAIVQLSDEEYCQKIDILSDASIGQHLRHVVEMFVCLGQGYQTGIVNYEKRKRDVQVETSRKTAIDLMRHIIDGLSYENRDLLLEAGFDPQSNELNKIPTNYFREIAYNLEHAIHHMALIKIGINQVASIHLDKGFGVASSTLKYWETAHINQ